MNSNCHNTSKFPSRRNIESKQAGRSRSVPLPTVFLLRVIYQAGVSYDPKLPDRPPTLVQPLTSFDHPLHSSGSLPTISRPTCQKHEMDASTKLSDFSLDTFGFLLYDFSIVSLKDYDKLINANFVTATQTIYIRQAYFCVTLCKRTLSVARPTQALEFSPNTSSSCHGH